LFKENSGTGFLGIARRLPLERSANFSGRLVAILVQFLEALLQRPDSSQKFFCGYQELFSPPPV